MARSSPAAYRITGIGIDIVDVRRIASSIARRPEFLDTTFTRAELKTAGRLAERARARHLAGIFAAKEAFYKALGPRQRGTGWKDIEVISVRGKPPQIRMTAGGKRCATATHLTISHDGDYAAAVVVLEKPMN